MGEEPETTLEGGIELIVPPVLSRLYVAGGVGDGGGNKKVSARATVRVKMIDVTVVADSIQIDRTRQPLLATAMLHKLILLGKKAHQSKAVNPIMFEERGFYHKTVGKLSVGAEIVRKLTISAERKNGCISKRKQTVRKLLRCRTRLNFRPQFRGLSPFKIRSDAKIGLLIDRFRTVHEFSHGLEDF